MGIFDRLGDLKGGKDQQTTEARDTESRDSELVDKAVKLIHQRDFVQASQILLIVASRTPSNYVNEFEEDGKRVIKFWDKEEFLEYVEWAQANNSAERTILWNGNAYPRAYYWLGYIQVEHENHELAIEMLDHGLKLQPGHPALQSEKAQCLLRMKQYSDALSIYKSVLKSDGFVPRYHKASLWRGCGYAFIEIGDLDRAESAFRRSQEFEPDDKLAANELTYIERLRNHKSIANQLGISQRHWDVLYASYECSLTMSGSESHWNIDMDELSRELGVLSDTEIKRAWTDLDQAIINRIKMRKATLGDGQTEYDPDFSPQ